MTPCSLQVARNNTKNIPGGQTPGTRDVRHALASDCQEYGKQVGLTPGGTDGMTLARPAQEAPPPPGGPGLPSLHRPGSARHGRLHRPGELGLEHRRRVRPRLYPPLDGHPVDGHADHPPAQRRPISASPRACACPRRRPSTCGRRPRRFVLGSARPGRRIDGPGRDPGRGHRPEPALPLAPLTRPRPFSSSAVGPGAPLLELLSPPREMDHRLRLPHRPVVPVRAHARRRLLGEGGRRLGRAPSFPAGSMPIVMAVLGAVVMPHNIFLHSEVIQSRQWNLER